MDKKEIRKKYLSLRKQLSNFEVREFSENIFESFKTNFPCKEGDKIHIFLSISKFNEVNTFPFIDYFRSKKTRIFVPKIVNGKMISVEFKTDTEMSVSDWGIAEPLSNKDCGIKDYQYVITPLLYCDSKGNRVGYGKGYYDVFFQTINPDCEKIGVGFYLPEENIDDVFENDVPLDYLITGDKILSFRGLL